MLDYTMAYVGTQANKLEQASKSNLYKKFVQNKIQDGEIASGCKRSTKVYESYIS